jgi:hypothetical protein
MKAVFTFVFFIVSLPRTLLADGVFVWNQGVDLYEPSQKAAILYDDGIEELVLQVKYKGKASDFGWLVPLPSRPEVTAADGHRGPPKRTRTRQVPSRQSLPAIGKKRVFMKRVVHGEGAHLLWNFFDLAASIFLVDSAPKPLVLPGTILPRGRGKPPGACSAEEKHEPIHQGATWW